jgi:[ribosomal protein S5]-alanine N-acetyltransferase
VQPLPTLETERLVLRPLASEDAATVRALGDDRRVAEMTLLPHPFGEEEVRQWVEGHLKWAAQGKSRPFSVLLKEAGAMVGHAGVLLDWDNEKAGLYYWMGVPYWGRGYATEAARELVRHAFEDLGLGRVYADHVARNPASGRVLQKVGMSYESCRKRDFKKWDRFEDLALYGVLAEEWSTAASASQR